MLPKEFNNNYRPSSVPKTTCKTSIRCFALVEMLIVIALIVLVMAMTMPFGLNFLQEQRIGEETTSLVSSLKTAQARAMAGKNDSAWGVKLNAPEAGQYILFQGDSYSERDDAFDEIFRFSSGVYVTGADQVIFEKLTGRIIME